MKISRPLRKFSRPFAKISRPFVKEYNFIVTLFNLSHGLAHARIMIAKQKNTPPTSPISLLNGGGMGDMGGMFSAFLIHITRAYMSTFWTRVHENNFELSLLSSCTPVLESPYVLLYSCLKSPPVLCLYGFLPNCPPVYFEVIFLMRTISPSTFGYSLANSPKSSIQAI